MGVEKINPDLKIGDPVKTGDFVGYAVKFINDKSSNKENYHAIHWQFGYANKEHVPVENRLCPMTYFDSTSKQLIEQIWAKVPEDGTFKSQFPDICNGYYKGKDK